MFRILMLFLLLLSGCGYRYHLIKEEKALRPNPPGTVKISDSLYMDQLEVSMSDWKRFMMGASGQDSIHRRKELLPDTLVWQEINLNRKSGVYFSFAGFDSYPVVGISYEQASAYCQWRTDKVNALIRSGNHTGWKFTRIRYRLPTRQEWELVAANKLDPEQFPYGLPVPNEEVWDRIAYHWTEYDRPEFRERIYTKQVRSLWPNAFGVYHIMGNVSEMLMERGIAKGGNFSLRLEEFNIKKDLFYTQPKAWLGFRCVCEIAE